MRLKTLAVSLAVAGLACGSIAEADAEEAEAQLAATVITATKTAKLVSEAPATVTVISAREIANKNVHRIEEALAGASGVFVRGLGAEQPSNYQNQITLRGIPGYYRTGVLVDGVAINNAFSGGVNTSIVPVDDVKQIEVVPGPFSSLYGGAGMAGVVNIITRIPEKREWSANVEGGTHNFRSVDFGYRDRLSDVVAISLNYGRKQSDGYSGESVTKTTSTGAGTVVSGWQKTTTSKGATTYIIGDKGREAWEQDNYGAKLILSLSPDSRLILHTSYLTTATRDGNGNDYLVTGSGSSFVNGTARIDGGKATINATDFLRPTNGEDVIRHSAAYETRFGGDYRLKANLAYQDNKYWYTSITSNATNTSGPGSLSDIPARRIDGDVQVSFPVANNHYLLVGASFGDAVLHKKVFALANWRQKDARGAQGDWANGKSQSLAAYVQDEIALTDRLTAYVGARYDRWNTSGDIFINNALTHYDDRSSSAVNPKASLVYTMESGTVVKGAIGKAFRAPNLSDMYSTYGSSTVYWSNPDLRPEKATTAEIGVEHDFPTGTTARATFYRSDIKDLVYSTTSGSNRYKFNAGTAETEGVDLELRQKILGGLVAFINTTFVETTIKENSVNAASVGKQIPLQPKKMANIGLDGSFGSWSGSVIGTYVGSMFSADDNSDTVGGVPGANDASFTINAKLAYRIDKHFSAYVALKNLSDREYYLGSVKADGRSAYVGLSYKY